MGSGGKMRSTVTTVVAGLALPFRPRLFPHDATSKEMMIMTTPEQ
jgi:hypothetical protein